MKLLRKLLPFLLILSFALTAVACSSKKPAESIAALRDHVREEAGVGKGLPMLVENDSVQVFLYLRAPKTEEEKAQVDEEPLILSVITFHTDTRYSYRLDLYLDKHDPSEIVRIWRFTDREAGKMLMRLEDVLVPADYTGSELTSLDQMETTGPETGTAESGTGSAETAPPIGAGSNTAVTIPSISDDHIKTIIRDMTNLALMTLDAYATDRINLDIKDFGFKSYSDQNNPDIGIPETAAPVAALPDPMNPACLTLSADGSIAIATEAETTTVSDASSETTIEITSETEENLGAAFSADRWGYAGRMTLLGMGMVFAVLALQWLILVIFRRIIAGKAEPKAPQAPKHEAPAPAAAVSASPVAPVQDDPAVIAAITAAIAAMIDSDPALSEQFIGGFRVVSFKKKNGKTSWNQ